jgi:hypothetical protein
MDSDLSAAYSLRRHLRSMALPEQMKVRARPAADVGAIACEGNNRGARSRRRRMCPPSARASAGPPLEPARAPGLVQPLLERATIDRFLLPGVAIAGAVDLPVVEQLAQFRERQLVIVGCGIRNGLQGLWREPSTPLLLTKYY